jgi:hypothetical protein
MMMNISKMIPMNETDEQLEKQAEEYRLAEAEALLGALGYLPDQHGRYWKEEDLVAQGKKFYRIARPCQLDHKDHAYKPANLFLGEQQQFDIGASPQDQVCRKCLGLLQDYLMFWVVEK